MLILLLLLQCRNTDINIGTTLCLLYCLSFRLCVCGGGQEHCGTSPLLIGSLEQNLFVGGPLLEKCSCGVCKNYIHVYTLIYTYFLVEMISPDVKAIWVLIHRHQHGILKILVYLWHGILTQCTLAYTAQVKFSCGKHLKLCEITN